MLHNQICLLFVSVLCIWATNHFSLLVSAEREEIVCIDDPTDYCFNKHPGFIFNNGCRMCKCHGKERATCKPGKCQFYAKSFDELFTYCDTVMEKNDARYRRFMNLIRMKKIRRKKPHLSHKKNIGPQKPLRRLLRNIKVTKKMSQPTKKNLKVTKNVSANKPIKKQNINDKITKKTKKIVTKLKKTKLKVKTKPKKVVKKLPPIKEKKKKVKPVQKKNKGPEVVIKKASNSKDENDEEDEGRPPPPPRFLRRPHMRRNGPLPSFARRMRPRHRAMPPGPPGMPPHGPRREDERRGRPIGPPQQGMMGRIPNMNKPPRNEDRLIESPEKLNGQQSRKVQNIPHFKIRGFHKKPFKKGEQRGHKLSHARKLSKPKKQNKEDNTKPDSADEDKKPKLKVVNVKADRSQGRREDDDEMQHQRRRRNRRRMMGRDRRRRNFLKRNRLNKLLKLHKFHAMRARRIKKTLIAINRQVKFIRNKQFISPKEQNRLMKLLQLRRKLRHALIIKRTKLKHIKQGIIHAAGKDKQQRGQHPPPPPKMVAPPQPPPPAPHHEVRHIRHHRVHRRPAPGRGKVEEVNHNVEKQNQNVNYATGLGSSVFRTSIATVMMGSLLTCFIINYLFV